MVDALMRCYDNEKAGEGTRTRRKNARCKQSVVHPQLGTRTHSFVRDTCVVFRGTVFVRLRVCIFVAIYMCNSCTCVCVCVYYCAQCLVHKELYSSIFVIYSRILSCPSRSAVEKMWSSVRIENTRCLCGLKARLDVHCCTLISATVPGRPSHPASRRCTCKRHQHIVRQRKNRDACAFRTGGTRVGESRIEHDRG